LKKRFAANLASKPPEEPTFFLDRSLGKYTVAAALRAAGVKLLVHDDLFPQTATDVEWLSEAGKKHWLVLTKDERIRFHIAEIEALRRANVKAFVLTARKDLTGQEMAEIFLKALPKIRRLATKQQPPFIAKVGRDGSVTMLEIKKPNKAREAQTGCNNAWRRE
jgi:predicted nuclease of predicted toxin-antitoxin system